MKYPYIIAFSLFFILSYNSFAQFEPEIKNDADFELYQVNSTKHELILPLPNFQEIDWEIRFWVNSGYRIRNDVVVIDKLKEQGYRVRVEKRRGSAEQPYTQVTYHDSLDLTIFYEKHLFDLPSEKDCRVRLDQFLKKKPYNQIPFWTITDGACYRFEFLSPNASRKVEYWNPEHNYDSYMEEVKKISRNKKERILLSQQIHPFILPFKNFTDAVIYYIEKYDLY